MDPYLYRKYNREELLNAWERSSTINECIKNLGMRVSGAAYESIKKILLFEGLIGEQEIKETKTYYNSSKTYNEKIIINLNDEASFLCKESNMKTHDLKKYIIKHNLLDSTTCSSCGISSWNNIEISMHLDHINGDNKDNRLENLRFLCPNCHSQTDTFGRSKNVRKVFYCTRCGKEPLTKGNKTGICMYCKWENCIDDTFVYDWETSEFTKEEFKKEWFKEGNSLADIAYNITGNMNSRRQTKIKNIAHSLGYDYKHILDRVRVEHNVFDETTVKEFIDKYCIKDSAVDNSKIIKKIKKFSLLDYQCECGLKDTYNGKHLVLQLDHINGIRNDHRLENLRFLCPNCHSQTDTYCGRNIGKRKKCSNNDCDNMVYSKNVHNFCKECYNNYLNFCECGNKKERNRKRCKECQESITRKYKKKYTKYKYNCNECLKPIQKEGLCIECYKNKQSKNIPSLEEIIIVLKENNNKLYKSGENFGVSDNAVKKWLIKYDVPYYSKELKKYLDSH